MYHDYLQQTANAFDLKGQDIKDFSDLAFKLENKQVVKEAKFKKAGERPLVKGDQVVMIPVYELNPDHYSQLEDVTTVAGCRKLWAAAQYSEMGPP